MWTASCVLPYNPLLSRPETRRGTPASIQRPRNAPSISVAGGRLPELRRLTLGATRQSIMVSAVPMIDLGRQLAVRRSPVLGLLFLLFVLSVAFGAIIFLAVISIPTITAFRRLAGSVDELVQVASEEVPGTLSSLKLSSLEINDLTKQLSNLRQRISGNRLRNKERKQ